VKSIVQSLIQLLFWTSATVVVWTYAGYPVFIALLSRLRPRPNYQEAISPRVSFVVPAYNEEAVIAEKLENLLSLDYPAELRDITVVADGSTDRTVEVVRSYARRGVRLLFQPERRGKIAAMNRAVSCARGEILIFSDANAMMERDSVCHMVRNFADPRVACVGGEKRICPDTQVQAEGESIYWRYESFLKRADSLVSTAMGAVGEFFAIRRELYRPLEEDCIIEDFVLAMRLVVEGWRVVYEPAAVVWEQASPSLRGEWERRTRNSAGGFQAIGRLRQLLSPRYGLVAFQFLSHKVLRWVAPLLMVLVFLSNAALYALPFYHFCFWAQVGFYALAVLGWGVELIGLRLRLLRMVFYFCFTNATALAGLVRYLTRRQTVLWAKVR